MPASADALHHSTTAVAPAAAPQVDRRPWVVRVRAACRGTDLPLATRAVALAVASYFDANGTWGISRKALCEELDIDRSTLGRHLASLKAANILDVDSGGGHKRNRYTVGPRVWKMRPATRPQSCKDAPGRGCKDAPGRGCKDAPGRGCKDAPPVVSEAVSRAARSRCETGVPNERGASAAGCTDRPSQVKVNRIATEAQVRAYCKQRNRCVPRHSPPGLGDDWPWWYTDDEVRKWTRQHISTEIDKLRIRADRLDAGLARVARKVKAEKAAAEARMREVFAANPQLAKRAEEWVRRAARPTQPALDGRAVAEAHVREKRRLAAAGITPFKWSSDPEEDRLKGSAFAQIEEVPHAWR